MKFTLNISATPPSLDNINNVIKQAFKINVCLWFVACKCQEELNAFSLVDVRFVALEVTATGAQTFLRVLVLNFELLGISVPETLAFSVFSSWIPVPKLNNTRNVRRDWVYGKEQSIRRLGSVASLANATRSKKEFFLFAICEYFMY